MYTVQLQTYPNQLGKPSNLLGTNMRFNQNSNPKPKTYTIPQKQEGN